MSFSRTRRRARVFQFLPGLENLEMRTLLAVSSAAMSPHTSDASGEQIFAPYIDMTAQAQIAHTPYMVDANGQPSLVATMEKTGIKSATLAFVNAKLVDGKVVPIWGSSNDGILFNSAKGKQIMDEVIAAQKAGLQMFISFGGITACQNGLEVAQLTSRDPAMMKTVYQEVISAFYKVGVTHFDFDIEGPGVQSAAAMAISKTRFDVLRQIQNEPHFSKMQISFVLAIAPTTGWAPNSWDGMFIKSAAASGIKVDLWNMMAFDYGPAVNNYMRVTGKTMVDALEVEAQAGGNWQTGAYPNTIEGAADYLVQYGFASDVQQAFRKMGVTLMIGQDDSVVTAGYPSPGYQVGDADTVSAITSSQVQSVLSWANRNNIGMLSFWSLNRDRPFPATVAYNPEASQAFTTASRYVSAQNSIPVSVSGLSRTVTYPFNPSVNPALREVVGGTILHGNGPDGYGGDFTVDTKNRTIKWGYIPQGAPTPVSATIAGDWSSITITYDRAPAASTDEYIKLIYAPKIIREYQVSDLAFTKELVGFGG